MMLSMLFSCGLSVTEQADDLTKSMKTVLQFFRTVSMEEYLRQVWFSLWNFHLFQGVVLYYIT